MLFSNKESIEDMTIRLVSKGLSTPQDIYEQARLEGNVRGVYKAIHYLLESSILVKSGKKLAISQEWIENLTSALKNNFSVPALADGESATYKYKSLVNLDAYWKHLNKSILEQNPDYPIFLYSPFNIWLHVTERTESQLEYYRSFERSGRHAFYVIGNQSKLDNEFKKALQSDFLQIDNWGKSPFKETEYITIIGDIIITSKVGVKLTTIISEFYALPTHTADNKLRLNRILEMRDISKIKVERNATKAKRLRKKLFKNFYLPKEVKEQYDLF